MDQGAIQDEAEDLATVAPDGDVVLVIGTDRTRLRVFSAVLSLASPVFKAMFSPRFSEGQQLRSATDDATISLPDDATRAVLGLCELLHYRSVSFTITCADLHSSFLLDFAVAVEKYALVDALRFQGQGILLEWLVQFEDDQSMASLGRVVTAAYLLDHKRGFLMATKRLVQNSVSRISSMLPPEISKYLSQNLPLIVILEEKRNTIQQDFAFTFPKFVCARCIQRDDFSYFKHITSDLPTPPRPSTFTGPPATKVRGMLMYLKHRTTRRSPECEDGDLDQATACDLWHKTRDLSDGICLDCLREGQEELRYSCLEHR